MQIQDVQDALFALRTGWTAPRHAARCVYGVYLAAGHNLPGIAVSDSGLLYIGKTETGTAPQDHFDPPGRDSGTSTDRRTLGALLREDLGLTAQPGSFGINCGNVSSYCFSLSGEARLSDWIRASLLVSRLPFSGDVASAQSLLVRHLEPPLNITNWQNPQRDHIMNMRRICAEEALLCLD
ncbi:GIY-YIG nuclease family protein [Hyphomonas sp.]|uniref:GIY-YIG nuclease family protein n=1 Tax=Hyphomonas sp. TaxID=87 RepID=UPI0030F67ED5